MTNWSRRIRGAIGMGLIWVAAWGVAGSLVTLGFVLRTGSRPDAPFPIMFGVFGFVAGVVFAAVLSRAEGRRRFDQMSLKRFAVWGAIGGFALATAFVVGVSVTGDPGFLRNLLVVGPAFAAAAACSAAGSLALARKGQDRSLLAAAGEVAALEPSEGRAPGAVIRRK